MTKDIVLNALLMAVWRRHPQKQVLVQSDQDSQYTRYEWLKLHGLEGSMSRRGNCHDNAVAESFFQLLKRERIKKKIYQRLRSVQVIRGDSSLSSKTSFRSSLILISSVMVRFGPQRKYFLVLYS